MTLPHPIDHEWRKSRNYFKVFYDVKHPATSNVIEHCWPNAGKIAGFECGEVEMRISETHPMGGPQLSDREIERLHEMYGSTTRIK